MTAFASIEHRLGGSGEQVLWSHAGGRYVSRYLSGSIDEGNALLHDADLNLIGMACLDRTGRVPAVRLPGRDSHELRMARRWSADERLQVVWSRSGPSVSILQDGRRLYRVEASSERMVVRFRDGFCLARFVRSLQIRTFPPGQEGNDAVALARRSPYANPLGRSPDEGERAIILGSPLYCSHTPEVRVPAFRLSLRCRAMLVGIFVADRLASTGSFRHGGALERESVAVGLGDGLVLADTLSAIGDVRTYSRAILGLPT